MVRVLFKARVSDFILQGKHQHYLGHNQIILTGFSLIPPELGLQEEVKFPWLLTIPEWLKQIYIVAHRWKRRFLAFQ